MLLPPVSTAITRGTSSDSLRTKPLKRARIATHSSRDRSLSSLGSTSHSSTIKRTSFTLSSVLGMRCPGVAFFPRNVELLRYLKLSSISVTSPARLTTALILPTVSMQMRSSGLKRAFTMSLGFTSMRPPKGDREMMSSVLTRAYFWSSVKSPLGRVALALTLAPPPRCAELPLASQARATARCGAVSESCLSGSYSSLRRAAVAPLVAPILYARLASLINEALCPSPGSFNFRSDRSGAKPEQSSTG